MLATDGQILSIVLSAEHLLQWCNTACQLTSVTAVCVFRVERVKQVNRASRSGFAEVLLLMICRAQAVLIQLALAVPQMPGQA